MVICGSAAAASRMAEIRGKVPRGVMLQCRSKSDDVPLLLTMSDGRSSFTMREGRKLFPKMGGLVGLVAFFARWICVGWLAPGKPKRPAIIEGLAEVVRTGWRPPV